MDIAAICQQANHEDLLIDTTGVLNNILSRYEKGKLYFHLIPFLIHEVYISYQFNIKLINLTKKLMHIYSDPQDLKQIYEVAKKFRDDNLKIYKRTSKKKFFLLLYSRVIENIINEWDEIATDCLVSSDGEIKDLILKIADEY